MERSVYLVLSQPGTFISKMLKFFTHDEYNHVSISLSPTLDKMYSFGRRNLYNPFTGGFIEEGKDSGIFKRFGDTKALVLEIKVKEEEYYNIKYFIDYFVRHKTEFKYNYFGVICAYFKKNHEARKKFYCSQFVRACLAGFNIQNSDDLPKIIRPIDFLKLDNKNIIFKGLLKNYSGI
ncbi:MAG: hypothetical protein E7351_00765 [Clostridiales bacterium]|nr:hypothetical protein [Clostridiales bacterium]